MKINSQAGFEPTPGSNLWIGLGRVPRGLILFSIISEYLNRLLLFVPTLGPMKFQFDVPTIRTLPLCSILTSIRLTLAFCSDPTFPIS